MHTLFVASGKYSVVLKFEKAKYIKHMQALLPNIDEISGRSSINVEETGDFFQIYIEATDTVAIRAALGSITRWVLIADRVFKEV